MRKVAQRGTEEGGQSEVCPLVPEAKGKEHLRKQWPLFFLWEKNLKKRVGICICIRTTDSLCYTAENNTTL